MKQKQSSQRNTDKHREGIDQSELSQWSRHYDNLLWVVTTIFLASIGALLAFSFQTFNYYLSLFGMLLTATPVYFAISFRESQALVNKYIDTKVTTSLFARRKYLQWPMYVLIFVGIEVLWYALLLKKVPDRNHITIPIGTIVLLLTFYWAYLGSNKTLQRNMNSDD